MQQQLPVFLIGVLIVVSLVNVDAYAAESASSYGPYHILLQYKGEDTEFRCSDGKDNDGDAIIDCLDDSCSATAVCNDPCRNGLIDFGEYWADCGGTCGDCPTCVDGMQNGDETGVDCGGPCIRCGSKGRAGQIVDVKNTDDYGYNFRMYLPPGYSDSQSFPLLLFLHGAGERGDDLNKVDNHGPLKHIDDEWWNYDFIVIAPQVPSGGWWNAATVKKLFDKIKTVYTGIDQSRVYITGLSMGGFGVNSIMTSSSNEWVTANAEICGVVATNGKACNYKDTPSWSFTCDFDPTVGNAWSISPWAKILHGENTSISCGTEGFNTNIKISLFDCNSHNSWARVYDPFRNVSEYTLSTDRGVNSLHQFNYGIVNSVPPIYDWFLHNTK